MFCVRYTGCPASKECNSKSVYSSQNITLKSVILFLHFIHPSCHQLLHSINGSSVSCFALHQKSAAGLLGALGGSPLSKLWNSLSLLYVRSVSSLISFRKRAKNSVSACSHLVTCLLAYLTSDFDLQTPLIDCLVSTDSDSGFTWSDVRLMLCSLL